MSLSVPQKDDQSLSALHAENLQLRQELQDLRTENQRMKKTLLQHTMERAVLDDQMSPDLTVFMEQFFERPTTPWYMLILFYGSEPSKTLPETAPLDAISSALTDRISVFGEPFFFSISGLVACLINALPPETVDSPETGEPFCRQLQAMLVNQYPSLHQDLNVDHISISKLSSMDEGPRALYRSAHTASEHRGSGESVCTAYDYALPTPTAGPQLYTLEQVFWQRIQQHAFFDAAAVLDQIIDASIMANSFLEKDLPTVFSRMELVVDSAIDGSSREPSHDPRLAKLLHSLSRAQTYQQMREIAYDILATLEDQFYTAPNARNRKLPQIEQFIRTNYTDPNLCAASIAEEFRISPSYLSHIFKADMGIGLLEYLQKIRIDAAKIELRNTGHTLDEISSNVGFSNRWIFSRVFKKYENMAPGAYRRTQGVPKLK